MNDTSKSKEPDTIDSIVEMYLGKIKSEYGLRYCLIKHLKEHFEYAQSREQARVRVLREMVMRGNYVFPENEEDLKWFEEGFTGKETQLFLDLSEILKLGVMPKLPTRPPNNWPGNLPPAHHKD